MIQATGISQAYSTAGSGTASAGLEAQLARLQQELSDCVNCASAKTTEGKAKIQAVEAKINVIQARLDAVAVQSQGDNNIQAISKSSQTQQLDQHSANVENRPIRDSLVGSVINTSA
ncbi:FlxA-like family protein [Sulfurirhabdus autotrophica]|uniref:FlxA-like protein n=1 Tax=Sulfurirhabdus autotrophica TaxID=1706046 RepID=A0A4R3Y6P0_9PROT|nr:FlxA-like family protein [Sulfurirhabdus autotrophica]TCV87480.1 FlxA-like protein [Sulfurirhabdus autotrophica]